jgi:TonB family protein
MIPLTGLAGHPMIHALGWTLLHFCWQGAMVAGMLWCVLGLLGGRSSTARYGAACIAMLLLVALPLLTFARLVAKEYRAKSAHRLTMVLDMNVYLQANVSGPGNAWPARASQALDHSMPWLLAAWLLGALFFLVRLNFGLVVARRLSRSGVDTPSAVLLAGFDKLRQRMGVSRAVRLLHSARVQVPTVAGWLKPVILVPASCLTGLSAEQIEAILCHELAHVRRHDYLVSVFQSLAEALLFYHPAVWWVSKQIRRERECCCDELAVANCGNALAYARALSYLEERRAAFPEFVLGANGGVLTMRIKRLLGYKDVPAISPLAVAAICLALMAGVGIYVGGVAHAEPRAATHTREPLPLIESEAPATLSIQPEATAAAPALLASAAQEPVAAPAQQMSTDTPMAPQYRTWLTQDVSWIISPEERAAYLKLNNDEERNQFIQQFWDRRDQMAGHGGAKEEHYGRIAYSNEHFASDRPGWSTDRGHIYIVLGKPDSIDSHPSGKSAVGSLPYEVWHYGHVEGLGDNIDLTFVEVHEGNDYRLRLGPSGLFSPGSAPFVDGPVRASPVTMHDSLLTSTAPIYPPIAQAAHVQGVVVLHATISKEGKVAKLSLISGAPMLVTSAMDAVKQWTYRPFLLNGQPTEVETTINVNFALGESKPGSAEDSGPVAATGESGSGAMTSAVAGAHYTMRDGATAPVVISTQSPEYSEEARKAKIQGTVLLALIVGTDGLPADVHVVKRLGHGLDARAVEAVKQYKFKPAMKDGVAVAEPLNIEVNFKVF